MTAPLNPLVAPSPRRVVVLGHPGHELALFGLLQRHPPCSVIVITDGGAPQRVEESRRGFDIINLLPRVQYLDYPERKLYGALLDHDVMFLQEVITGLRAALDTSRPSELFCDAVEFYNPVHDITLPLVRAALAGSSIPVYEIPLVYELSGQEEHYRVQRAPDSLAHERFVFDLSPAELAAKTRARDDIYCSLHEQAGPELLSVSAEEMAHEEIMLAADPLPAPGDHGRSLRYERRARLLHDAGRVDRVITYLGHVTPMLDALGVPYHHR